jgi:hypothetical protein
MPYNSYNVARLKYGRREGAFFSLLCTPSCDRRNIFMHGHASASLSLISSDRTGIRLLDLLNMTEEQDPTSSSRPSRTVPSARPDCPGLLVMTAYKRPAANCVSSNGSTLASGSSVSIQNRVMRLSSYPSSSRQGCAVRDLRAFWPPHLHQGRLACPSWSLVEHTVCI